LYIKLTEHARLKIAERDISLDVIRDVVSNPELKEKDKFDSSLTHLIGRVGDRFLRVIGRWKGKEEFIVISAFFDRRVKKRREHSDKD
jgi:hypothetical protein